jgi:hypothetical protein
MPQDTPALDQYAYRVSIPKHVNQQDYHDDV